MSPSNSLSSLRVALVEPSAPSNIGAVARAMKVMGCADLVLVAPRFANSARKAEAIALASGALDVLNQAPEVATVEEAIADRVHVLALSRRPRDFAPPVWDLRQWAQHCAQHNQFHQTVLLFGTERVGLSNADVLRCTGLIALESEPEFGSLNLAQAVQVVCYEARMAWRAQQNAPQQLLPQAVIPATRLPDTSNPMASRDQVEALFKELEKALIALQFLDPRTPKTLMPRLRAQFARSGLTPEEVNIWRGIARAILQRVLVDTEDRPEADSL